MLYSPPKRGSRGLSNGDETIDARPRDERATANASPAESWWRAVRSWAADLVAALAPEQPAQHIAVFVPDPPAGGLRLVAQAWGAGENTGEVVVGEWTVPFEASVCGRVYRTGSAALVPDASLDPDFAMFPGSRSKSSLTVPVGPPGEIVAVINVEAPWIGAFAIRDYDHLAEAAAAAYGTFPRR